MPLRSHGNEQTPQRHRATETSLCLCGSVASLPLPFATSYLSAKQLTLSTVAPVTVHGLFSVHCVAPSTVSSTISTSPEAPPADILNGTIVVLGFSVPS